MELNEVMGLISDMEAMLKAKKSVSVDASNEIQAMLPVNDCSRINIEREKVLQVNGHQADEYLILNRSGAEIINVFFNAITEKKIEPKYAVIIKKWSVLGEIVDKNKKNLSKYNIYYPYNDKSVCLIVKKGYCGNEFEKMIVDKYQMLKLKFEKTFSLKKLAKKLSFKNIKKKLRSAVLKNKFLRNLYSVWRENRGFFRFVKAIFRIIGERISKKDAVALTVNENAGLDICIYDIDKEQIVKESDKIKCNSVTVVVCVYNALEDVKELLTSLWNERSFPYEIIIIDDGSEQPTKEYLEYYSGLTGSKLVRHDKSWGYTKSANDGLRRAESDYVVLLNSDTIVTGKWIEKMLEVFFKYPNTGIVGPLSNSATYQNVPKLHDFETGNWVKNLLPDGFNVELMSYTLEINSQKVYPIVPVLNGFCTMISREVIDKIGYLDEVQFPIGYGEEVDYCLRARNAGFELRVADDTYIFHEKSKSFGNGNKKALSKQAAPYLTEQYGEMYKNIGTEFESNTALMNIRNNYNTYVNNTVKAIGKIADKKIGFVLLTRGGNGGANSVCQEVIGMRKLGINAYVVNTSNYMNDFSNNYPELVNYTYYYKKGSTDDLYEKTKDFDVLIATIFTSVAVIRDIIKMNPRIRPAYYIQDYETLFFEKEDVMYKEAFDSYTLIKDNCMFAKTDWLVRTVSEAHHEKVNKVTPSIDIRVYNPYLIKSKESNGSFTIAAMVRPRTPRRNPGGTLNVLKNLKQMYGAKVEIVIFGCNDSELEDFKDMLSTFEYTNLGVLKKGEVAALLARADIFIDMSYYQAFGRTGLESMCYGCIPVLPKEGGTDEYAIDKENSIVVDTNKDMEVVAAVADIINQEGKIKSMQKKAIATARRYCVLPAAWSELKVLNGLYK